MFTAKSTKNEIIDAYNELLKEKNQALEKLKASEQELAKAKAAAGKAEGAAVRPAAAERTVEKVVVKAAAVNSVDGIIATLASIRQGLGAAVSELSAKLAVEASALGDLLGRIKKETAELKSLYGITAEDGLLDRLMTEYEQASRSFAEESERKRKEFELSLLEKRKAWKKEQEDHEAAIAERDEALSKEQERENAEYEYQLKQARRLEADAHAQKKKQLQQELDALVEAKENSWAERERQIQEREKVFNEYKARFEELPARLEKEVKKAESEGVALVNREAKVKADLFAKEIESLKRLHELRTQALEATIKSQEAEINRVAKQLESALRQGQDLAIKAIEGSSSSDSLAAMREIALEQAKNQPKAK
jgi:hypothetical protein